MVHIHLVTSFQLLLFPSFLETQKNLSSSKLLFVEPNKLDCILGSCRFSWFWVFRLISHKSLYVFSSYCNWSYPDSNSTFHHTLHVTWSWQWSEFKCWKSSAKSCSSNLNDKIYSLQCCFCCSQKLCKWLDSFFFFF